MMLVVDADTDELLGMHVLAQGGRPAYSGNPSVAHTGADGRSPHSLYLHSSDPLRRSKRGGDEPETAWKGSHSRDGKPPAIGSMVAGATQPHHPFRPDLSSCAAG